MDFDADDKMFSALAEKLGVDAKAIDLICPIIGEDTGSSSDEWHYGYYFEIPTFADLDEQIQIELKELIDITTFPFGKTIYFSDGELSDTKADPFGWRAEFEEAQYYQNFIFPKEKVIEELNDISSKIKIADDSLIIKALIFSAFSITESFVRATIWRIIPDVNIVISDKKMRDYLQDQLSKELTTEKGRREIYKRFTGNELGAIPNNNPFRNSLAHDIGSAKIEDGNIIVATKGNVECSMKVERIIDDLVSFVNRLGI